MNVINLNKFTFHTFQAFQYNNNNVIRSFNKLRRSDFSL